MAVMAVINDFHVDLARAVGDGDLRGRAAMLEGVGERFLDDAVRRQVDRDGGFGGFTCFRDGHLQAGLVDLGHENGQVGQTRSRGQDCVGFTFLPQYAQETAHLGQRRPAGGLDRGQCPAGLFGLRVDDVMADPRLDRDHAHGVGDDVVKLTGNAQSLLDDGPAYPLLPLHLDEPGAFLQGGPALTTVPQVLPEQTCHRGDQKGREPGRCRGHRGRLPTGGEL